jgi:hypothetical protein
MNCGTVSDHRKADARANASGNNAPPRSQPIAASGVADNPLITAVIEYAQRLA